MTALSTLMALRRTFQLVSSSSEAPPSSSLNSCPRPSGGDVHETDRQTDRHDRQRDVYVSARRCVRDRQDRQTSRRVSAGGTEGGKEGKYKAEFVHINARDGPARETNKKTPACIFYVSFTACGGRAVEVILFTS